MLPRLGPRFLALTGSILFSGGYLISGLALHLDVIPLFYLGYGVIGGVGIGMGYVTPVATVAKWFPDRKGLATGIVVMGFGIGGFLLSKGLAPFLLVRTEGALPLVFIWLGIIFACVLIPCSFALSDPPPSATPTTASVGNPPGFDEPESSRPYLGTTQFVIMWTVFFFNIAAGISVVSFQSEILQEIWGLADDTIEPTTLAEYGATLIAVSSICNGLGRLFWGLLSDGFGTIFRVLLASQMVVFGILMTETNPWVFSALVCYVLLCFGGGFATMPPFVLDVFGTKKMSTIYGVGRRRDFRAALPGLLEGCISRSSRHVLLPHRDLHARRRLSFLLPVERRKDSSGTTHIGKHPAPVWDSGGGGEALKPPEGGSACPGRGGSNGPVRFTRIPHKIRREQTKIERWSPVGDIPCNLDEACGVNRFKV